MISVLMEKQSMEPLNFCVNVIKLKAKCSWAARMHFDMDQMEQQLSVQTYKFQRWKI